MKNIFFYFLLFSPIFLKAQPSLSIDTLTAPSAYENIHVQAIASDSLVSSFVIFIKNEVKKHRHEFHSEHVFILEGEGEMVLGEKSMKVKKGDFIFIPKNTPHSLKVTSSIPMKVLSVQAPKFIGKDRLMME